MRISRTHLAVKLSLVYEATIQWRLRRALRKHINVDMGVTTVMETFTMAPALTA